MAVDGHLFGGGIADFVVTSDGSGNLQLAADTPVWLYNAQTSGTRYTTGLTDVGGADITSVTSDATGAIPQLRGPDGVTEMWADANEGAGPRRLMTANDLGDVLGDVAANAAAVAALQGSVDGLATVAATGEYDDLVGAPTLAAVATSGSYTDLSGAPAPGLQYVLKTGGSWPVRSVSAPDSARPAVWIGAEPAPSAGGLYALDGDAWWPTP